MQQSVSPSVQEKERLQALHACAILDTPPEAAYDRIVQIAKMVFDVPVTGIVFLDEKRQWYKARYGINFRQTSRSHAFCAYTIQQDETLVVPDTHRDPRFASNPYVLGKPSFRFYAGAPLITPDGFRIGSICIADYRPRRIPADKLQTLRHLADMVMSEMTSWRLEARNQQLASFVESSDTGTLLIDTDLPRHPVTYANRALLRMLGHSMEEVRGCPFRLLFGPENSEPRVREAEEAIVQRKSFQGVLHCTRKDCSKFQGELTLRPLFGEPGQPTVYSATCTDVTARLQMEEAGRRDRSRLLGLAANFPGMVFEWLTYRDGTPRSVPFVSEGCRELFGLDPATLQTDPDFLLHRIPVSERREFVQSIADCAASLRPWHWRGRVLRPDSEEERWLQGNARPERLPGGDLIWECVLMDVTQPPPKQDQWCLRCINLGLN